MLMIWLIHKEGKRMNIGDIVVVIGSNSVPLHLLGYYGKVVAVYDEKVNVEFIQRIGRSGNLSHTVFPNELIKVGESIE
jgi:hypothetical protein